MDKLTGSRHSHGAQLGLLALLAAAAAAPAWTEQGSANTSPAPIAQQEETLESLGIRATGGAASGYVGDETCSSCHEDLYRSYQAVGMARSFYRPGNQPWIEDFEKSRFHHLASDQHFEMQLRGDGLYFKRWLLDDEGQPRNIFEQKVDWILGSGGRSRTYLYQTPGGELYQLPLAWYTQTNGWGMAPGFDRADHEGVMRRVRRECMFCHNAYPDVASGSDAYGSPPIFPQALPEGIGCQRCHGPGGEHVRRALTVDDESAVRASIVNPKSLDRRRRLDVCYQCHLQPSVALPGVRRFDRRDYSFRPGEMLTDYLLPLEVEEEHQKPVERFEINHHPYRLEQSRCFIASGQQLECLTCHDPHRKVAEADRAGHYRAVCLNCHQSIESSGHPDLAGSQPVGKASDCVSCHMPQRRTQDVVKVVMTDHLIQRQSGGTELLAALKERDPVLTDVSFWDPQRSPSGDWAQVYRAVALIRAASPRDAVLWLEKTLSRMTVVETEPYLDLASGQLFNRRFEDAEQTLRLLLKSVPAHPVANEWLALALARQGRREEALGQFRVALAINPRGPEVNYNFGVVLLGWGQARESVGPLSKAVKQRPNFPLAWLQLGRAHAALEARETAADALFTALRIEPSQTDAYLLLGEILIAQGKSEEAMRLWRLGKKAARHPEKIDSALAELVANRRPDG